MSENIDRRIFLGSAAATVASQLGEARGQAGAKGRKLGTCGPPPRKTPTRQTSAEGMPPLPLPAVPLRRSEPKAEPSPPLMVAKMEYGDKQDWNTDPGDVDNLMRHVRSAVGLWYGWKQMPLREVVALYKAKKEVKVPALYFSGHEAFSLSADERGALAQYLLDGGTIIGDACCGRAEFAGAFLAEMKKMFPRRPLDRIERDHPMMRAFYKYDTVNHIQYKGTLAVPVVGPPELHAMNLGCRAAVIFSPWDLSCGWDEHTHKHGKRLHPGDAIRLGINIISYIAALRQVAEVQATTKEIAEPAGRKRQKFTLAQLRHHGDWDPDPNSTVQLLRTLASVSSLAVSFDHKAVDAKETELAKYPFLYMTGFRDPRLNDDEVGALRRHLHAGGFLFVNNCSGYNAFDRHARRAFARLFPDGKLESVGKDDPLMRSMHVITAGKDRQTNETRAIELEGVKLRGRWAMVYSKNDMITHLKLVSDPFGNGYDAATCRRLAANVVAYAMQN
jgi:hypothetical protein